jgi:hypothetical protein
MTKLFFAFVLSIAAIAIPAQAGLVGDSVTVNYDYPAVGTVLFPGGTSTIAAGGTTFNLAGGLLPVVVSNSTIAITFINGITFANNPAKTFDGLVINDATPDIGNVTLASTNIPGFISSDVTFNSNNVFVNFPNSFTSLSPGATITIDVAPVTATPEPTSLALLLLGVPATLFVKRRFARS